jgi:hypothetical protein
MSQADFLKYVVPNGFMSNERLLECSIEIMKSVVENPGTTIFTQSYYKTRAWETKLTKIIKLSSLFRNF